jgi:hypothetical protein
MYLSHRADGGVIVHSREQVSAPAGIFVPSGFRFFWLFNRIQTDNPGAARATAAYAAYATVLVVLVSSTPTL